MSKVLIENYEITTCHGVNPEEKINPQRFLISCVVECDFSEAAKNDDIDKTVSYSAVCKTIKAVFGENCYNLIETLAVKTAKKILTSFDLATAVTVTVKKPDAPMKGTFDWVGVETSLSWHKAYLSLGSNTGDRAGYLDLAIDALTADENVKDVRESTRIETEPWGGVATEKFLNSAVEIKTLYTPRELLSAVHEIEEKGNRVRKERWGNRTLDLDIIFYDDLCVEDDDLIIPHPETCNRVFVLAPLDELCPNKIHPIYKKRVKELLADINNSDK